MILDVVAGEFNLEVDDLLSRKRDRNTARARQVAMYILWLGDTTLRAIGREIGGRSPATVSHGFQVIAEAIREDEELREKVNRIKGVSWQREPSAISAK